MEEARYWMWQAKRNNNNKPDPHNNNNNIFSSHGGDSWEEQAFMEDAAGGALVWPPRSYSCSFCRREFRSAQALGGHMNVHRRDRARLKQSPQPPADVVAAACTSQTCFLSSNTNPNPVFSEPRVSSPPPPPPALVVKSINMSTLCFSPPPPPAVLKDADADGGADVARPSWSSFVAKSGNNNNNNKRFFSSEDDEEVGSCNKMRKRRRINDENPSSFFPKLRAVDRFCPEELDLELRLGTIAPKVK